MSQNDGTKIEYVIGLSIYAPIKPGVYQLEKSVIKVEYLSHITTPLGPCELPKKMSTVFKVSWTDKNGTAVKKLYSKTHERFLLVYEALDEINKLLLAFKFVSIGHIDGLSVRNVGIADSLFHACFVDGVQTPDLNMRLRHETWDIVVGNEDPHNTTALAIPHIKGDTNPVSKKFVRCFELTEHGYYTEALVVGFSILDDRIQLMLKDILDLSGIIDDREKNDFLRSIKERRLETYLGPILKLLHGNSIYEMWEYAADALSWLNTERNRAMHGGYTAKRRVATISIYACMRLLSILNQNKCLEIEFPIEMYREAKLKAAWSEDPPKWVPKGPAAETKEYN